ncbi:uncharacterized protein BDFB_008931 [Asbolus verrucosus]|uniref:Attacin C-terminal domain-containing protein n=1 Tax=Asbolus verrucosus TaxID=1661398 RepID=A0A482VAQ4_ASBVE|nr:uncharacterized protein BDFB_008931 [Asbolus verrucosus]
MQKLFIIAASCLALSLALPKNFGKDPKDQQSETKWDVKDPGILSFEHREKLFEKNGHRVDGTAVVNKNFVDKMDPWKAGGRVDYKYLDSKAGASLEALNAGRFGTKVGAEGTYNLYKGRNSALDLGARYEQSFGGQFGRSEPTFGGFLRATF